jgi:hypothetical protein
MGYDGMTSSWKPTWRSTEPSRRKADWPKCGARTRAGGSCRVRAEPGRTRCRFHGGLSTGPRTPEGRQRISEANRRRWAAWRAARQAERATAMTAVLRKEAGRPGETGRGTGQCGGRRRAAAG